MMVGCNYRIGIEEAPIVGGKVHNWNTSSIRAALSILHDRQELGQLRYHAKAISQLDGDEVIHREIIEIAYRVRKGGDPES
jgi:hypothetical protein